MPESDVTIFNVDATNTVAQLTGAQANADSSAVSASQISNPVSVDIIGANTSALSGVVAKSPHVFPINDVYEDIVSDRGGIPIPITNTRYWSGKPDIPAGGTTSTTVAALNTAIAAANAGDVLYLQDGTYNDAVITIGVAGVIVCAETVGGVRFTGDSQFDINADDCDVIGFNLTDTTNNLRIFDIDADDVRIARCTLRALVDASPNDSSNWITVDGINCRICYCTLDTKVSNGMMIHIQNDTVIPTYCRVDHNELLNQTAAVGNPGTIQIGQDQRGTDYFCLIDNNYIYRHNNVGGVEQAGSEIIVIKSSSNIVLQNVFEECLGHVRLTKGSQIDLYGNYWDGANIAGAGGVRLIGDDNRALCNYFRNLNSGGASGRAAMDISDNTDSNELSFNTIFNCRKCLTFGRQGATDPDLGILYNNAVEKTGTEPAIFDTNFTNFTFGGNVMEPIVGVVDAGINAETPDFTLDNGFRVPTAAGNCDATGVTGHSAIATVDILGTVIPGANSHVGCFQAGFDLTDDPQQTIINAAGA